MSKPRKYTKDQLAELLAKKNFELLEDYKDLGEKVEMRCFCGKIFRATPYKIFSGWTTSCGCLGYVPHEEVERRFKERGLELLEKYKGSHALHKTRCFCGNIFITRPTNVQSAHTASCGCMIGKSQIGKRLRSERSNWVGHEEIGGTYWNSIRKASKRRGKNRVIPITVTIQQVWELFLKQDRKCALSGRPIFFKGFGGDNKNQTASLDRIDSRQGYSPGNVQWVHKDVNIAKQDSVDEDFIKMCKEIADYQRNRL